MGSVRPEKANKAKQAKDKATAAGNSVPEVRDAVVLNSEAIQRLETFVERLQRRLKKV